LSDEPPFNRYKEHASGILLRLSQNLDRAQQTRNNRLAKIKIFQADIGLRWLTMQYRRFNAIMASSRDTRWDALRKFINHYSNIMELDTTPLPFFGESYYVSGSFTIYKKISLRLEKDYFELCVDHTDPPIFWPLIIHEIAHCWLSKNEYVDNICSQYSPHIHDITLDIASNRIEEALCDIIATRVMGPAYPMAFVNRLWALFQLESQIYPKNRFRIECMAKVLDIMDFREEARKLRSIGDEKFEYPYEEEEVSCTLNELCRVSQRFQVISTKIRRLFESPTKVFQLRNNEDYALAFYSFWLEINEAKTEDTELLITSISNKILNSLIRSTESNYPST